MPGKRGEGGEGGEEGEALTVEIKTTVKYLSKAARTNCLSA